jgi:hypothetical protein
MFLLWEAELVSKSVGFETSSCICAIKWANSLWFNTRFFEGPALFEPPGFRGVCGGSELP